MNQAALERGQALVAKAYNGKQPKGYADMRQVFDDKDVAAVSMPLPNHWHALATIWACQAGKDVYVEKPACHNVWEGRKMVEAARKYNRMVQVGIQSRIDAAQDESDAAAAGRRDRQALHGARALLQAAAPPSGTSPIGPRRPESTGTSSSGPAPMRPFNENRFAYNWHWFWDTGNGDIGNQGVHEMDIARWGLDLGLPKTVTCTGGRYHLERSGRDAEYADWQRSITAIARSFSKSAIAYINEGQIGVRSGEPNVIGDVFFGSDGTWLSTGAASRSTKARSARRSWTRRLRRGAETGAHMQNFLAAVKSRNHEDLHCRCADRRPLGRPLPPCEHRVPHGPQTAVRSRSAEVLRTTLKPTV